MRERYSTLALGQSSAMLLIKHTNKHTNKTNNIHTYRRRNECLSSSSVSSITEHFYMPFNLVSISDRYRALKASFLQYSYFSIPNSIHTWIWSFPHRFPASQNTFMTFNLLSICDRDRTSVVGKLWAKWMFPPGNQCLVRLHESYVSNQRSMHTISPAPSL